MGRGPDLEHPVGILCVVVVEPATRSEGVVHPVADRVAQLVLGHAPVQGEGGDDLDVVDAGGGRRVEHRLDDALAHVGLAHLREREADVVEADGELHVGEEERGQRLRVAQRILERSGDRAVDVLHPRKRFRGVDDPATACGKLLEREALAVVEQDRWGGAVDVDDQSGAGHQGVFLRSNAILVAPRRPASAAWEMASV